MLLSLLRAGLDLVYPMRLASWVGLWTVHLISNSCDGAATYIVSWRAADDGTAVISLVADRDYF